MKIDLAGRRAWRGVTELDLADDLAAVARGRTAAIDWFTAAKRGKPVLVASGKLTVPGAGAAKLKLELTRAGKRLLKHAKRLKLTAKGSFTPTGKKSVTATATFTLGR